ncbi:MAG: T9SS C-terminal target domain-containing protein [Bacteroidetes bacterium]|nr:MAG: T9SS C-terminal target domain-containing protein [Bacteroidota bacterium]
MGQPDYLNSASNVGNAASATVNLPAGTVFDNLLLLGLMFEKGNTVSISPPPGWNLIIRRDNGSDVGMAIYYKVAGGSEPENYSFGLTNGAKWAIACSRISNASLSTPVNAVGAQTGYGSSVNAPSLNTTVNNTLVLCFYTNKKFSTYTPHASTIERYDFPNSVEGVPSNMMASFVRSATGSTGSIEATSTDAESWVAAQVAINPPSTLPVSFQYFKAEVSHHEAFIKWATVSEVNNDYFIIEKSKNGVDFEFVDLVNGAGNSNELQHYIIADRSPYKGLSYYRIKQIDYDGCVHYSVLVSLEFIKNEWAIYLQNPFDGETLRMSIQQADDEDEITVDMFALSGNRVFSSLLQKREGIWKNEFTLPYQLKSGMYLIILNGRNRTFSKWLLVW